MALLLPFIHEPLQTLPLDLDNRGQSPWCKLACCAGGLGWWIRMKLEAWWFIEERERGDEDDGVAGGMYWVLWFGACLVKNMRERERR